MPFSISMLVHDTGRKCGENENTDFPYYPSQRLVREIEPHNIVSTYEFHSRSSRIFKSTRREDDGFASLSCYYCLISWNVS